ncbi:MAG: HEAT repeat domain-containing protein, partial [Planctomycetes bacterium]|nr:HEAT repeat domain-containing protein [Planctomycetota bacterium]
MAIADLLVLSVFCVCTQQGTDADAEIKILVDQIKSLNFEQKTSAAVKLVESDNHKKVSEILSDELSRLNPKKDMAVISVIKRILEVLELKRFIGERLSPVLEEGIKSHVRGIWETPGNDLFIAGLTLNLCELFYSEDILKNYQNEQNLCEWLVKRLKSKEAKTYFMQFLSKHKRYKFSHSMLKEYLYDKDVEVQLSAISAVSSLKIINCSERLAELLTNSPFMNVKTQCLWALSALDAHEFKSNVAKMVYDKNEGVSATALYALMFLDPEQCADIAVKFLKLDSNDMRNYAFEVLGRIKSIRHAETVAALLKSDDEAIVNGAIWTLGEMGAVAYSEEISNCLKSSNSQVKYQAVITLGKLRSKEGLKEILALCTDKEVNSELNVKPVAAEIFCKLAENSNLKEVASLLKSNDNRIKVF